MRKKCGYIQIYTKIERRKRFLLILERNFMLEEVENNFTFKALEKSNINKTKHY